MSRPDRAPWKPHVEHVTSDGESYIHRAEVREGDTQRVIGSVMLRDHTFDRAERIAQMWADAPETERALARAEMKVAQLAHHMGQAWRALDEIARELDRLGMRTTARSARAYASELHDFLRSVVAPSEEPVETSPETAEVGGRR